MEVVQEDGNSFRRARLSRFLRLLDSSRAGREIRILDLGGTAAYWASMSDLLAGREIHLTIVNVGVEAADTGMFSIRPGDARNLKEYPDDSFDFVHSNSVIEHVGGWADMMAMAGEVRRLAPAYFVQTPYFWFPIEPHFRAPFFHWLPEALRARLLVGRRLGFRGPAHSLNEAMCDVETVRLLDVAQMTSLFPDGCIWRERVFGATKSIVAWRQDRTAASMRPPPSAS